MKRSRTVWIILLVVFSAAVLRLAALDRRPMHTDEAVQAAKFGILLEEGTFEYNPAEFHGPTLLYLTLVPARLAGMATLEEVNETLLRAVPAVIGVAIVLLPFFFAGALGRRAMVFAAVLLAFSPAFVFYSRYYIQEILFVFFLGCFLGCLWKYLQKPSLWWAVGAGTSLGLLGATKETWVLVLFAVVSAGLLTGWIRGTRPYLKAYLAPRYLLAFLLPFMIVWVLFYTAFGTQPQGLIDSIRTYVLYLDRGSGSQGHAHPWWYYLDILTWMEFFEKPTWNEDGIIVFAFLALLLVLWRRRRIANGLLTFLTLFAFILLVLYSVLPYKTPWNVLPFLFAMTPAAGASADWFIRQAGGRSGRAAAWGVFLLFGLAVPAAQSTLMVGRYHTSPSNPYVYGHTGPDIFEMAEAVQEVAERDLYIQVFAPGNDYWPWPWYLRNLDRVAYDDSVDPDQPAAPVIVADARLEGELIKRLYVQPPPGERALYLPLFERPMELRPGIEWRGYIKKDYLDSLEHDMEPMEQRQADNTHRFRHEAMNAMFEIFIDYPDQRYAQQAARAAFDEIDRLEKILSRFIPNSDVSRIRDLKAGQIASISPETMECLLIAQDIHDQTGGIFDVTVGSLVDLWKEEGHPSPEQITPILNEIGMDRLELNQSDFTVRTHRDNVPVDLGGIGKGYAVDCAGEVLREWGINRALIHGGLSSILALDSPEGKPGWSIRLSNPQNPKEAVGNAVLSNQAISCSGLRRATDMIDPRSGQPVQAKAAAWVRGPAAARCDALSTAFMIMTPDQVKTFCEKHLDIGAIFLPSSGDPPVQIGKPF